MAEKDLRLAGFDFFILNSGAFGDEFEFVKNRIIERMKEQALDLLNIPNGANNQIFEKSISVIGT
jgi:hypothetical protein